MASHFLLPLSREIASNITTEGIVAAAAPSPDKIRRIAHAYAYPKQVYYLIASFIALVSLCHFTSILFARLSQRSDSVPPVGSRTKILWRRVPLAVINMFRAIAFRWTVPVGSSYTLNLAEVFLTAAYITLLFTYAMINSTTLDGSVPYDPHYWANIAGNIVSSQLPLMTALGMKNNIISLLTGVSFEKLNFLHRMSARVLCVLIWLHAGGRIVLGLEGDSALQYSFVRCGILAGTSLTVLCFASIRPLRSMSYEIFLIIHLVLALIFIFGAYFHAKDRDFGYYVWPTFILWGLDRVLRGIRIFAFNLGYFKPQRASSTELDATIDVLSPSFLRVTIRRPDYFHWLPGQSAYLTFPSVSTIPLEAHPFTISTIDVDNDESSAVKGEKDDIDSQSILPGKKLVFLIRVQNGFTKRLLNAASGDPNCTMKAIIDGPYSSPPLLRGYGTVILIAGGSGISFTLPLFLDLIHRAKKGKSECRKIVFIWAIREASHIQWIADTLLADMEAIQDSITVDVRFFVSSPAEDVESWDESSAEDSEGKIDSDKIDPRIFDSRIVQLQRGRPSLQGLLDEEIMRSTGAVSVSVCGSHTLTNSVRVALRTPRTLDIMKGGPSVTLHVEAFGL